MASLLDRGKQCETSSLHKVLSSRPIAAPTVPGPPKNNTPLSRGRNQTPIYKAERPSLASLLKCEVQLGGQGTG